MEAVEEALVKFDIVLDHVDPDMVLALDIVRVQDECDIVRVVDMVRACEALDMCRVEAKEGRLGRPFVQEEV